MEKINMIYLICFWVSQELVSCETRFRSFLPFLSNDGNEL